MKISIDTKVSSDYNSNEINIVIQTSKICPEVEEIIRKIQNVGNNAKTVIGRIDNNLVLVKPYQLQYGCPPTLPT